LIRTHGANVRQRPDLVAVLVLGDAARVATVYVADSNLCVPFQRLRAAEARKGGVVGQHDVVADPNLLERCHTVCPSTGDLAAFGLPHAGVDLEAILHRIDPECIPRVEFRHLPLGFGRDVELKAGILLLIEAGETHEIRASEKENLMTINIYSPPAY